MIIVGLTGGIATGKSSCSKYLREKHGVDIIDADTIAHQILEPGTPTYFAIIDEFGLGILQNDTRIDRAVLGSMIFQNKDKRSALNRITHPTIRLIMLQRVIYYFLIGTRIIVLDTPLLFESSLQKYVHRIVVVYTPENIQLQRLVSRDRITYTQAQSRISSQMPIEEKKTLADYLIDNSENFTETRNQIDSIVKRMKVNWFQHWLMYFLWFWIAFHAGLFIWVLLKMSEWNKTGFFVRRKIPTPHFRVMKDGSADDIAPAS